MDNIEELLRALTEDDETEDETPHEKKQEEAGGGLFDGLDIDMLMKLMTMLQQANQQSDDERFLLALRPLLREENRAKIDTAVKFMKLLSLLPVLRESGMLGKLL
ncbi:MAG: hypothetical protein ACI4Q4_08500 [Oscillospiraceae bacterium]